MHETVPDSVWTAEIELIDISPEDLMRADEGRVYLRTRRRAMMNFFREGNLTALREMALRLAAERVGRTCATTCRSCKSRAMEDRHRLLVAVSESALGQMVSGRGGWRTAWTRIDGAVESPTASEADQERWPKSVVPELGAEVMPRG